MNKKIILAVFFALSFSKSVEAAAVAGGDSWQYFFNETPLTAEHPVDLRARIKIERDFFHGPDDYPTTFGETKTAAAAQFDLRLRLAENWYAKGRFQGNVFWRNHDVEDEFDARHLFIDGKIGDFGLRVGKIPVFDSLNLTNGGLIIDSEIKGGEIRFPVGKWKIAAGGGAIDNDDYDLTRTTTIFNTDSTLLYLQAYGDISQKWSIALGLYNMYNSAGGLTLPNGKPYSPGKKGFFESGGEKNNTVFSIGLDYRFNDMWTLGAIYSKGSAKITEQAQQNARESSDEEKSYSVQLTYGHPEIKKIHNTSAWLAYRHAGRVGSYTPAYQGVGFGEEGFEIGVRHQLLDNLALKLIYFDGKKISRLSPPAEDRARPDINNFFIGIEYEF